MSEIISSILSIEGVVFSVLSSEDGRLFLSAVMAAAATIVVCGGCRFVVLQRLGAVAAATRTQFDDTVVAAVASIRSWVCVLLAAYAALSFYTLPGWWDVAMRGVVYTALVWQAIEIAGYFVRYVVTQYIEKDEDGDGVVDPAAATMAELIALLTKWLLWLLGGLFVLSAVGVEVTSLVAGLGIGGIAVAFALQGILADLFASFSIYFDKPFRIGDFITVGADAGTVEKIGIKSTRLRDLQGEELVISNAELTTARIHNFKKMQERRIVTTFGVTYDTSPAQVRQINNIVAVILADIALVRFDRCHFTAFGDSALQYEVVYYIQTSDYTAFLDAQQQFNYALLDAFAAAEIAFAYPTQMVYHQAV